MATPTSIRLRLERARHHLDGLQSEVDGVLAHLKEHGVLKRFEAETGDNVWTINSPESLTENIPILAGDFVHNLRSVLDYIVYALDPQPDRRPLPEFPICQNGGPGGDGFHQAGIAKIWTLPMEAKIAIEGLQPYQGGNKSLLVIHRLDITDKHRRLLTTTYAVPTTDIAVTNEFLRQVLANPTTVHTPLGGGAMVIQGTGRFKHGDEIARQTSGVADEPEHMKLQPKFQIALEEPQAAGTIMEELRTLYDFVGEVVLPKFEPLFS